MPSTFRGALPPSAALPPSLRRIFEPSVLQALDGLWKQIETETLIPLFLAEPRELAQVFQLVHPRFAAYYVGATMALVANVKQPELIGQMVTYSFDALGTTLQQRGPANLGRDATIVALIGAHTMGRIFKAAAQLVSGKEAAIRLEGIAEAWTRITTAYMLAMFGISCAISQADSFEGRWENVQTLAHWSRAYAAQARDLSVRHGILRLPPRPSGDWPVQSTEEDLELADAGLEDYARLLADRNANREAR